QFSHLHLNLKYKFLIKKCQYPPPSFFFNARSVLCNDPDMYEIPVNVPVDTVKLRIEKTVIRRIPTEAFYYLVDLKYLWVTYNCVANIDISSFYNLKQLHELRLDGNLLSTFPWESLAEMPNLRTLDLHNNKVTSIPADAGRYLRNLTYLDISSNKLTTLPSDLMDIWESLQVNTCLQDNPWFCDCRISKLIEFSKIVDNSVVLLDPLISCSGPENLAGILFQRAELEQCLKPSVMTSATKITSPLGSNVLLRCDATGYPTPQLTWTRSDNIPVNYTETPGEGVRWSIISLTGISYKDAGEYRCKAKNLAGMSEASVTTSLNTAGTAEQNVTVKNLRVISETDERVTLTWKTVNATSNSAVTVLYSKYGEKDMLPLSTDSSKNKVTIDGLQPSTQYMACVSPKGVPPTKEQCVIFSTDSLNDENGSQFSILILASSAACVVVLPLIFFLLYKVLKLHVKPKTAKEADLARETYVKFETLSLKPRTVSAGEQLWARRYTDESERLLLCSRSSMDSQMTFKSEGSRSEYLC
uniref:Leucine rich repeat, Ig-like and transmembrane domains 3 n=1 Tax=Accipiter nisus TaxID=211598 RepID=A0A8B9N394_9AVES